MSDPTGGGDLLTRIVIERQGGDLLKQTREEVTALRADVQQPVVPDVDPSGPFKNLNRELEQGQGHLRHVRTALTGLAFEATGAGGPIGHLASSLLLFGGGSGVVLGVAAAVGVLAGAYKLLTETTKELTAQQDKLDKQYRDILAHGAPNVLIMQQLVEATDAQAAAYAKYAELRDRARKQRAQGDVRADLTEADATTALGVLSTARSVTNALRQQLEDSHTQLGKAGGAKAAAAWVEQFRTDLAQATDAESGTTGALAELYRRMTHAPSVQAGKEAAAAFKEAYLNFLAVGGGDQAFASTLRALRITPLPSSLAGGRGQDLLNLHPADPFALSTFQRAAGRFGGQGMVDFQQVEHNRLLNEADSILERLNITHTTYNAQIRALDEAVRTGTITHEEYTTAVRDLTEQMERAKDKSLQLAVSIVGAVSGAIAAIVSGGSPGGVLSGIGGVVGLFNPLAGGIIGGLGSILSAADHGSRGVRIDSYSQAAIEQMKQAAQTAQRLVFNIINPTTGQSVGQVVYEAGRRTARDAIVRAPSQG